MQLRIAGTVPESTVDGPGVRYVVFVQGCNHYCQSCHNPDTWDVEAGTLVEVEDLLADIANYTDIISGVTISGGEPLLQIQPCLELVSGIKTRFNLNIVLYTGYTLEEALGNIDQRELVLSVDYVIDGPYDNTLRKELPFRGSANQRFIKLIAI